jgi:membrane protein
MKKLVLKRTFHEFNRDQCTDLAAALTYYAVLALFPFLLAMVSLLGLVSDRGVAVQNLLQVLRDSGAGSAANTLEPTLTSLGSAHTAAGFAFAFGLLSAWWSASGYVGAFSRAMNRMYGITEGRPFWKLRPIQLAVTGVSIILVGAIALALVVSGKAAQAVGNQIGVGDAGVKVWDIAKLPVILVVVMFLVALLYYASPNVRPPHFKLISAGAVVAVVTWVIASVLFGIYLANFASYNKTYGALAGVIAFLLWVWITNLALLFGAELESELERGRELSRGEPAEADIQLELRDTRNVKKSEQKEADDIADAREARVASQRTAPEDSKEDVHAD